MQSATFVARSRELETYFDRTAAEAWKRLTSDAPVSGIRATVRAGRDRMRATLMSWLPGDLHGKRVLDAGCGPGRVGAHLHEVGHEVVGVDADPVLIAAAEEDHPGPRWLVEDLAELFGVELPEDDDVETVGGLLARELGLVPIEGASAEIGGLRLVAESTGGRRNQIDTLLVTRVPEPGAEPAGRPAADDAGVEQQADQQAARPATREEQPAGVES